MLQGLGVLGAALIVLLAHGVASAQSGVALTRAGSGARAAGMGDAFVAVSDDGTAASWNPAGLAQLRKPEFSLVYAVEHNRLHLSGQRSPDDRVAYAAQNLKDATASPDFVGAALPFSVARRPVTLQLGWHRLYRLGGQLAGDTDAFPTAGGPLSSFSVSDQVTGNIDVISLAGAVKLTSRAAVGASFDFWRGGWSERLNLVEQPPPPAPTAFLAEASEQKMRGRSATVGLLLTYPTWNVGLVYHAPFWSDFRIRQEVHSTQGPAVTAEAAEARFRLPRSVAGGVARRLGTRWTVAVAVTHDEWSDTLLDGIPGLDGAVGFFDGLPPELSTTRDAVSINAGLEHLFLNESSVIPLRLGVGWEPQGAMDPITRDPVDFLLLAGGAGYNTNRFKLDAAVQYRAAAQRVTNVYSVATRLTPGIKADAIGRANAREWRIKVSAIYRMPDTEKLRDVLRRIFG
jgi:long-subunit fatty acid transport protein